MKVLTLVCVCLCAAVFTAPASAYGVPRSMELALEDEVMDFLEEDSGFLYQDADYDCERLQFRTYECEAFVEATALRDITITDMYGDEITVMEDDQLECYLDAFVRKRAAWSRYGRYRIKLDNLECEVITDSGYSNSRAENDV